MQSGTRRLFMTSLVSMAVGTAGCGATAHPQPTAAPSALRSPGAGLPTGGLHDFDFLAGAWTVVNHRLKNRWVGSHEWDEFPATDCATIYIGSVANVDEIHFTTKGWAGVTLRTFDIETHRWSIYWVNSKTGVLFPPVVGGFDGDRGVFYGDDTDEGIPVKERFIWTKLGPDRAHWEQAFSRDGGRTWEVNWTNDFTRADPSMCVGGRPRS